MDLTTLHREDIKAELRKRFGSVAAFERSHDLPEKSVTDLLRGYKSARVQEAVVAAINSPLNSNSEGSGNSSGRRAAHRLNAGAK